MNKKIAFYSLACLLFFIFTTTEAFSLTLYVDATEGKDGRFRGDDPASPFKTITYALNEASTNTTIKVAPGEYNETIIIDKNQIWLEGAGADKTIIIGKNPNNPTIRIVGPNRVGIRGFSIQGGYYGILCEFSFLICEDNIIIENNHVGLLAVSGSNVTIKDTIVKSKSGLGIEIYGNSSATINKCKLSLNPWTALWVVNKSYARIEDTLISSNDANGIQVSQGSSAWLIGNKIHSNKLSGLSVTGHSDARLLGGNKIYENADLSGWRAGIGIYHGSQVTINPDFSSDKDRISENNGPGIFVGSNSELFLKSGIVTNNSGDGVRLKFDSCGRFEEGASITNNDGYGINRGDEEGDSKYWGEPGELSGNTLGSTNCKGEVSEEEGISGEGGVSEEGISGEGSITEEETSEEETPEEDNHSVSEEGSSEEEGTSEEILNNGSDRVQDEENT